MDLGKHHRRFYTVMSLMTLHVVNFIELRSQLMVTGKALAAGCGCPGGGDCGFFMLPSPTASWH